MDESTRIKYAYTIILLGTIVAIFTVVVLSTGLNAINGVINNTPIVLWTMQQTMLIIFISIFTLIGTWLCYSIGSGSILQGLKLLRSVEADKKLNTLLTKVKEDATKNKNHDAKG